MGHDDRVIEAGGWRAVRSPDVVGRDAEVAWLNDGVRAAAAGRGRAVFVVGEAGYGKSRLVDEVTAEARRRGGVVLVGRATERAAGALRPVREALLGAARAGLAPAGPALDPFRPVLGALVPDWASGSAPEEVAELDVGEAVVRFLRSAGADGPAVLALEDLHWADDATLAVVEYVAEHAGDAGALVVVTCRPGAPAARLGAGLASRGASEVIDLRPLGVDGTALLASRCLAADELPAGLVDLLVDRSDGVPFYVEEVLAALLGAGRLRTGPDGWELRGGADVVPARALDVVRTRLDRLDPSTRRVLGHAAVLGRRFDAGLLAERLGDEAIAAAVRAGVDERLLVADGSGHAFRHALTAEALRADLTPLGVAEAAGSLLDALLARYPDPDGDRSELAAGLAEQAGRTRQAGELLARAGRRNLATGLLGPAERLLRRARDLVAPADEMRGGIDAALVEVVARIGRTDEAIALAAEVLDAGRCAPGDAIDVRLAAGRAAATGGRWRQLDDLVAGVADDPVATDEQRASALLIVALGGVGRNDAIAGREDGEAALAAATAAGAWRVACEALEVIGRAHRTADLAAAEEAFERARRLARVHDLRAHEASALHELGTIDLYTTLRLDRLTEARRRAEALGSLATVAVVDLQLAALHVERTEVDAALAAAARSTETAERLGLGILAMTHCLAAMAHARRPDRRGVEDATAAIAAARPADPAAEAGVWGNAWAMLHLVEDDLDAAVEAFDRGMERLEAMPYSPLPFVGLWALVRTVLDRDGDRARAVAAARRATTPISALHLAAAEAVAQGRAGERRAAAERFAEVDADLARRQRGDWMRHLVRRIVAPAQLADGWGDPVPGLRAALAHFEGRGYRLIASSCRRLLDEAGAPVPRQGRGDSSVPEALAALGLTSREVDVLVLVADGLSNAEAAARLHLSPRTVEKHVERILAKTGRARRDLAALVATHRPESPALRT